MRLNGGDSGKLCLGPMGWLLGLAVLFISGLASDVALAEVPEDLARQSLRQGGFPWYDAARDDIKPTRVRKPREVPEPSEVSRFHIPWSSVGIILICLAMAAMVILGYWAWRRWAPWQAGKAEATRVVAQLQELPLVPEDSPQETDLLQASERAAAAGDYRRAIIWLYAYQLTELDRHRLIRLMKGKTNRQYLRELGRQSPIAPLLERTIVTFEEAYFGGRSLSAEQYEACRRELPRFEQWLKEIAA